MSVISQLRNLAASFRVQPAQSAPQAFQRIASVDYQSRSDFLEARRGLVRIQLALEALGELLDVSTRFRLNLPDAISSQALGLDLTHTAATLSSTGEINASPMSFSPFGPEWNVGSTAAITIGGEYDGVDLTGALSFEVRRPGIHGIDNLRIRVENPAGDRFGFNIRPSDPPDEQYDLRNGLYLTLGDGLLVDGDTTSIQLFDSIGAAVDPNRPLGGIRNDNPNFQYYPAPDTLPAVVDGSFQLNGENISVSASDSLNDVVDTINLSNAGVTAVFNPTTERVEFAQNTLGSAFGIDIQGDTSNLIQSTKLDTAVAAPGIDPETIQAFADVAAFSSVQSGNILINGTPVSIDAANDSLTSVLASINASAADVTASFDEQTQLVRIEADDAASELEIDSNGTGLFSSLYIAEGRVDPEVQAGGISRGRSYRIADAFEALTRELNQLFTDKNFHGGTGTTGLFRAPLDSALRGIFGDADSLFGVRLDHSEGARRRGGFASIDRQILTQSLQLRGDEVKSLFAGADGESGLITRLFTATTQALANVGHRLGQTGTFVDTYV